MDETTTNRCFCQKRQDEQIVSYFLRIFAESILLIFLIQETVSFSCVSRSVC